MAGIDCRCAGYGKVWGYQIMIVNVQDQSRDLVEFGIKRLPAFIMIHVPTGKHFILTYSFIEANKIEERMVETINSDHLDFKVDKETDYSGVLVALV